MKTTRHLLFTQKANKLFGIFVSLSLSLSLLLLVPENIFAQSTPYGIVIASDADYMPNGEGYSIDTSFNTILTSFGTTAYEQAFPFAITEAALNCYRITISNANNYSAMASYLDSLEIFDEVILQADLEVASTFGSNIGACTNPLPYDDPEVQGAYGYYIEMANLPCAWEITTGDPNCTVAIPDIFFDESHDDLEGKFESINMNCNQNLSNCGHGFAMAGSVAAIVNNDFCTVGSGYNTKVAGYCVGSSCNTGNPGNGVTQAYQDGHKIISVSWTGLNLPTVMIEEIVNSGVTIVGCAYGNGWNKVKDVPGVILIGQLNSDRDHEPYNGWEAGVDIYAPCLNVIRLQANNSCGVGGKGSFGTAMVAGVVALMKSVNPDICPADYAHLLDISHQGLPENSGDFPEMTAGILDAEAAVIAARDYKKYTISGPGTTIWDEDMIVNELIIEPLAELKIVDGAVIKFGANAEVTVKRGARLVVDGSTLSVNECSGDFWRGIHVWGNPGLEQPSPNSTLSSDNAGIVIIKNASLIERAKSALMTTKKDEEWNSEYCGGVVYAQNREFIGNRRVGEFMKYDFPNKSKFENCLLDGTTKGVTIWDTDGISFKDCRFYNMEHQGILAYDAGVVVSEGNDFQDNQVGIASQATYPFSGLIEVGDIGLDPNYFLNNFIHVQSNASSFGPGLRIRNNEFFNSTVSIFMTGPSRFEISDNVMENSTTGVYAFQTAGLYWNQHTFVQNNTIEGNHGIIAEGKNRELQFRCNQFDNTRDFVLRQEGNLPTGDLGEIRIFQGQSKAGADNCFTNPVQNSDIQTVGQTLHFDYYKSGTQTCRTPVTAGNYSIKFAINSICGSSPEFNENSTYTDYLTILDTIAVLEIANPGSDTLATWIAYRNIVMTSLLSKLVEADSITDAFALLNLEGDEAAALMRYGIAVGKGMYILADSLLADFADDQGDMTAFKDIQTINLDRLQTGLTYSLSQSDSLDLEEYAVSEYSSKAYARALLGILCERYFYDVPAFDEDYFAEERWSEVSEKPEYLTAKVRIFPNPAKETLTVAIPDDFDLDELIITNAVGQLVQRITWPTRGKLLEVNLQSSPSGTYTLQLLYKGAIVYANVFVVQQ